MKHDPRIDAMLQKSREVIRDCSLENGAIVAANTDKPYTPREAANYRSVWPRDAAFVAAAANLLGDQEIGERFLTWVYERPEGLKKEKLLFQKYSTNGRKEAGQFQADQMGTLLWFIREFFGENRESALRHQPLITLLAEGLAATWNGKFFNVHVTDLWEQEERHTTHTMGNNFTYTLAASARGLMIADEYLPNPLWKEAANQMIARINEAYSMHRGYYLRNHGKVDDTNIDASLLGLTWPFALCAADDLRMLKTVAAIETALAVNGGVHRFQFDYYDGEGSAQEGGGAWPVLNFWMSMYWMRAGNRKRAEQYFFWVLDHVAEKYHGYLPEQLFGDERTGIYPLAWSHAMFVFACEALGYLKK